MTGTIALPHFRLSAYKHLDTLCVHIDKFVYSIRMLLSSMLCETITDKFKYELHRNISNRLFIERVYVPKYVN